MSGAPVSFVVIAQPYAGLVPLVAMLNRHTAILCHGDRFAPGRIVETDPSGAQVVRSGRPEIVRRDADPAAFLAAGVEAAGGGFAAVGQGMTVGAASERALRVLAERADLPVIRLRRANLLAQVIASPRSAHAKAPPADRPVALGPLDASARMNRAGTLDGLFEDWFARLPHRRLELDHAALSAEGTPGAICAFLGIAPAAEMTPAPVPAGPERVIDRVAEADRAALAAYIARIGREEWLGPERA